MRDITKEIKDSDDALNAILPEGPWRVWEIRGVDAKGTEHVKRYVQSELSFFEKQDFTTLIGSYFERFAEGEFGIGIKDLFSDEIRSQIAIPTDVSAEDAEQMVEDNAGLIKAIIKVVNELPDLQLKIMMIALGVPPNERKFISEILRGPVVRGGLTDDQGFDILKLFITHNAVVIRDFFLKRARDLVEHAQAELFPPEQEESPSDSTSGGTPSSTTPRPVESIPSSSEVGQPVASS